MGTRGLFGFRYKGRYYLMYNHWDSYFSGLGIDLLKEIKEAIDNGTFNQWIELFKSITIVDDGKKENYLDTDEDYEEEYCELCDTGKQEECTKCNRDTSNMKEFYDKNNIKIIRREPNKEDIIKLNDYKDLTVSDQSAYDWYCLLRKVQGSFKKILESQYMLLNPNIKSITGDLFIEYSYILDFDSTNFYIYTRNGFYKTVNLLDNKQINETLNEF